MLEPWKHLTGQSWNHELRQLWLELLPAAENRGEILWMLPFFGSLISSQDLPLAEPRWTPADMGASGYVAYKCQPPAVELSKENQGTNLRANRPGWTGPEGVFP